MTDDEKKQFGKELGIKLSKRMEAIYRAHPDLMPSDMLDCVEQFAFITIAPLAPTMAMMTSIDPTEYAVTVVELMSANLIVNLKDGIAMIEKWKKDYGIG